MSRKVPAHVANFLLGLLFVLALLGCGKEPAAHPGKDGEESKSPKSLSGGDPTPKDDPGGRGKEQSPGLANKPADFTLDAKAWKEEWKKDSAAAGAKYRGKVIELSGAVDSADQDPFGAVGYVFLLGPGDDQGVRCATVDKEPWAKVSPGSKVKIKGVAPDADLGMDGGLVKCVITEAGPNPAIVTSARQLAADFTADREGAKKKYDEKWVIADGEVSSITDKQRLILSGQGPTQVPCEFPSITDKGPLVGVKKGDKVKMFGRCYVLTESNKIALDRCMLITK